MNAYPLRAAGLAPNLTRFRWRVGDARQGLFVRPRSIQKHSPEAAALGKIQAWARMLHAKAVVEDETNFQVFTALDEDLERVSGLLVCLPRVSCGPPPLTSGLRFASDRYRAGHEASQQRPGPP